MVVITPLVFLFGVAMRVPVGYPRFNVSWEPTYAMSKSTIANPTGSAVGDDGGVLLRDSQLGKIRDEMRCSNVLPPHVCVCEHSIQ